MAIPAIGANFEIAGFIDVENTGNLETDAQQFARANRISVAEARSILNNTETKQRKLIWAYPKYKK